MLPFSVAIWGAQLSDDSFRVIIDDDSGAIVSIINPNSAQTNWVSSPSNAPWQPTSSKWGLGYADIGGGALHRGFWTNPSIRSFAENGVIVSYVVGTLNVTVTRQLNSSTGSLNESFTFTNTGNTSLNLQSSAQSLAIYTPFNDHYTNSADAQENRTHAHIWAGGLTSAWVKTTRMSGAGPHLGLVLTRGSLKGYSIEGRDTVTSSNTRGVFLLHPVVPTLAAGESTNIAWTLFWHEDWDDFFTKAAALSDQFIEFNATSWTVFPRENVTITMRGAVEAGTTVAGHPVTALIDGSGYSVTLSWTSTGEKSLTVSTTSDGVQKNATIVINVVPDLDDLIASRTQFITTNQQITSQNSNLSGAYVLYDNQMDAQVTFDTASDRNSGRERVGMGVLISRQLGKSSDLDAELKDSLIRYYRFVCTQLQRADGYVYNGPGVTKLRVYNFPWISQLHLQIAKLDITLPEDISRPSPLERFMLTVESMYANGASDTYPIGIPIIESLSFLKNAGNETAYNRALELFTAHGERIDEVGTNYPPQEVNYEQSVVAPAAIIPLELYLHTKNETWLDVAKPHFNLLTQFGGRQPDYHLHDVAIRHWDGYWFGKDRMWGDVFPHYWSTLTGIAMHHWGNATNDISYVRRAEGIMRANLALFAADGSASCAWLYPLTVDGRTGHYKDAYANDQDWALAHYLQIQSS